MLCEKSPQYEVKYFPPHTAAEPSAKSAKPLIQNTLKVRYLSLFQSSVNSSERISRCTVSIALSSYITSYLSILSPYLHHTHPSRLASSMEIDHYDCDCVFCCLGNSRIHTSVHEGAAGLYSPGHWSWLDILGRLLYLTLPGWLSVFL